MSFAVVQSTRLNAPKSLQKLMLTQPSGCAALSKLRSTFDCFVFMQNERVLYHYNGHGVPRPTVNGEVWVFNKSYTQYIPMSVYDLHAWVGTPCIYVFDCSAAGLIVNSFRTFAEQRQQVQQCGHGRKPVKFACAHSQPLLFLDVELAPELVQLLLIAVLLPL